MSRRLTEFAALVHAQMWPGVSTPRLMSRVGGGAFLLGAVMVVMLTTVAPISVTGNAALYTNAAVSAVVGLATLLWDQRLRLWQVHVLVLIATLQITVSVYNEANPTIAVALATLYVWVACAAFFVAWPTAVLHLAVAVACCIVALIAKPNMPWWSGLVASGTTAALGVVIAILGRIVSRAELDDFTGLPNRRGFDRLLGVAISRAETGESCPAVALLSVDNYASVHEDLGDEAADEMVQQVAATWRAQLAPELALGRIAVDRFAVLIAMATEQEVVSLANGLRASLSQSCSAGVTTAPKPGEPASVVMARADSALRRARRTGRNRTIIVSARTPPVAVELRDSLAAKAIDVAYQPIVSVSDGAMVGLEALVRWAPASHPDIEVSDVIAIAEETDLIAALDRYVLRRACLDALWLQERMPGTSFYLSANVSGLELVQADYATKVFQTLAESGWPAEQLVLEVTESVIDSERASSIEALQELRAGGVRIAIDDFGTGYSSLSRLHAVKTDLLKLDASFIAAVTSQSREVPPLLQAVTALAQALQLPVIVEGVETVEQVAVLRRLRVAQAQGFYFGRPQTREALARGSAGTFGSGEPRRTPDRPQEQPVKQSPGITEMG